MYKKIFVAAFAAVLAAGAYAQETMYLIKGNQVVAKYNTGDVDYVSFELPEGVTDNTGDNPSLQTKSYVSAVAQYYGTTDNVADYIMQLSTREVGNEGTPVDFLYLQFMGPAADYHNLSIPEGSYTMTEGTTREAMKFYAGEKQVTDDGDGYVGTLVVSRPDAQTTDISLVTGGEFSVAKTESGYKITGMLKLETGNVLEFSYEGACMVENKSDEKDAAEELPLPESSLTSDMEWTVADAYIGSHGKLFQDMPHFEYIYINLYGDVNYENCLDLGLVVDHSKTSDVFLPKGKYSLISRSTSAFGEAAMAGVPAFTIMGDLGAVNYGCWITEGYITKSPLLTGEVEVLDDWNGEGPINLRMTLKDNSETPHTVTCTYNGSIEKI